MRVVRAADAVAMPWRNGGGVTREYLAHPTAEHFDWRLSVAEVTADGPFSAFPGLDRILVLLSGKGMSLSFGDGTSVVLSQPMQHHRFPGEAAVQADLLGGPTTDLNLFWRRDAWVAEVDVLQAPCDTPDALFLVYVAQGSVHSDGQSAQAGDVLWGDGPTHVQGDGRLVVFSLRPATAASP